MRSCPVIKQLYHNLVEKKIMNRWFIFLIDILIVVAASQLALLLSHSAHGHSFGKHFYPKISDFALLYLVSASFFVLVRTYVGIVRYTNIFDFQRIFLAQLGTVFTYFAYLHWYRLLSASLSIGYLVNYLLLSSFLLLSFRITIVSVYNYLSRQYSGKVIPVYIWNTSEHSLSMANLLNNSRSGYRVLGFIDDGNYGKRKHNTTLPILDKDDKNLPKRVKNILFLRGKGLLQGMDYAEAYLKKGIHLYTSNATSISSLGQLHQTSQGHSIRPIQIEDLLGRDEITINQQAISQELQGKVILVTGAAGSIGSEIVRQLIPFQPKLVICFDQAESPLHELQLELNKTVLPFRVVIGDIRNHNKLEQVFKRFQPQVVYHAAAYKHVPLMENDPCEAVLTNLQGTRHAADLALQYQAESFVMISTDKAVNPTNIMGASKRLAEIYAQALAQHHRGRTKFITTRFGNVLGSNGSVIPLFKKQIEAGGPLTVTHPEINRYFMTIPEACRLVLEASVAGANAQIYVFDMGKPVKIVDLARRMIELAGLEPEKDIRIVFTGLRPGEKLYEELLSNHEHTAPTPHPKIRVANTRAVCYTQLLPQIDQLLYQARQLQTNELVSAMKQLIPEYLSANSPYEVLDLTVAKAQKEGTQAVDLSSFIKPLRIKTQANVN